MFCDTAVLAARLLAHVCVPAWRHLTFQSGPSQGRELQEQLELSQKAFMTLVCSTPAVLCTEAGIMQLQQVALFLRRCAGADGALFSAIATRCPAVFAMEVAPLRATPALAAHPKLLWVQLCANSLSCASSTPPIAGAVSKHAVMVG